MYKSAGPDNVSPMLLNPLGTVDGCSSSLRDATGPVDVYSRIPTSTQVTCLYSCIVHMCVFTCKHVHMHKYCIIVLTCTCTRSCKISDFQHLGATRRSTQLAAWQKYRHTTQGP